MTDNIIYDQHYQGIPLAIEHGPFLENRLADALATIENIMQNNRCITVASMELRVPEYNGLPFSRIADTSIIKFVK